MEYHHFQHEKILFIQGPLSSYVSLPKGLASKFCANNSVFFSAHGTQLTGCGSTCQSFFKGIQVYSAGFLQNGTLGFFNCSYKVGPYCCYKWGYNPYKWPYKWVTGVKFHPTYYN